MTARNRADAHTQGPDADLDYDDSCPDYHLGCCNDDFDGFGDDEHPGQGQCQAMAQPGQNAPTVFPQRNAT